MITWSRWFLKLCRRAPVADNNRNAVDGPGCWAACGGDTMVGVDVQASPRAGGCVIIDIADVTVVVIVVVVFVGDNADPRCDACRRTSAHDHPRSGAVGGRRRKDARWDAVQRLPGWCCFMTLTCTWLVVLLYWHCECKRCCATLLSTTSPIAAKFIFKFFYLDTQQ